MADLSDKVNEVLDVQASRGQILSYTEQQAKEPYPGLTIVSLGAIKEGKPNGVVSARVLFDGNNGIPVNKRIRLRDQERAPIAADLKR